MVINWGDGSEPALNAGIGLVVLIDVVKRQTDELAVDNSLGVVEGVTVGFDRTDKVGSTLLDAVVEFAHSANEGVTVR